MVRKIADGADMIVRGYAFTRADDFIRVFNLNDKEHYLEMYEMWKTDSDNGFYEK